MVSSISCGCDCQMRTGMGKCFEKWKALNKYYFATAGQLAMENDSMYFPPMDFSVPPLGSLMSSSHCKVCPSMDIISSPPTIETVGKHSGTQEHIRSNISGLHIKLITQVKRPMQNQTVFFSLLPVPKKDHIVLIRPREANKRNMFPRDFDL